MAIKTGRFWQMFFLLFCGEFPCSFMQSVYKILGKGLENDAGLTRAGSIGSISNGVSRVFWGIMMDFLGFQKVYSIVLCVEFLTTIGIVQFRNNLVLYTICVALSYFCQGAHSACFNTAAVKIFGMTNGGFINTLVFWGYPLSSLAGFFINKIGSQFSDNFTIIVVQIGTGLVVVNMISIFFFDESEMVVDEHGKEVCQYNSFFHRIFSKHKRAQGNGERQVQLTNNQV
jgi:MFS family permease